MPRKPVSIDFRNVMEPVLGEGLGIREEELHAMAPRLKEAVRALGKRRWEDPVKHGLAWMRLPYDHPWLPDLLALAMEVRARFENLVVLGIGGSALGNIALQSALNHPFYNFLPRAVRGGPRLFVLDNIDPELVGGLLEILRPEETCFNVISKSGATAETMAQFLIIRDLLEKALGPWYRDHLVVITDPEEGALRRIAERESLRTLPIPKGVGGRFSVLSPVGLFSAACCGIDVEELLAGAVFMDQMCSGQNPLHNRAAVGAAIQYLLYEKGHHITVMMPYSHALRDVADWFRQLWAESLGKRYRRDGTEVRVGPTPVKALGTTDQHSQLQLYVEGPRDKVVCFLQVISVGRGPVLRIPDLYPDLEDVAYLSGNTLTGLMTAESRATALALRKAGCPNLTYWLSKLEAFDVGQLLYLLELQTAIAGELWDVNAFDQPGVEFGKQVTYGLMGRPGYEHYRAEAAEDLNQRARDPRYRLS
ncbi:MAG: glucose-6-phosphate isomerase [Anaerolineae bacterium]